MSKQEARRLPALQLAHIGDAVYELAVRHHLLQQQGPWRMEQLHKATVHWVQASAQAAAAHMLRPSLTSEETAVFYRARNAKQRCPKNTSVADYCYSTALEALLGFLYLTGQGERLQSLMDAILAAKPHEDKEE